MNKVLKNLRKDLKSSYKNYHCSCSNKALKRKITSTKNDMRELKSFKTTSLNQNHHQWPPVGAPTNLRREEPWRSQFDDSVNAVSFGFVATAILISMFLVMAIFERLIRTTTTSSDSSPGRIHSGLDSRVGFNGSALSKLGYESPKMGVYSKGVSVLMPGDNIPTFIAHLVPAPAPAPRDSNTQSPISNSIQEC